VYQRDFILRIIEQLGRALLQVRRRIMGQDLTAVALRDELRAIAQQAGMNLELLRTVDSGTLPILLAPAGEVEPARCWLAAELLYLESLHARQSGRAADADRDLLRAIELYGMLSPDWTPPPGLPGHEERLAELRAWLA
jgi:hypothetical protein